MAAERFEVADLECRGGETQFCIRSVDRSVARDIKSGGEWSIGGTSMGTEFLTWYFGYESRDVSKIVFTVDATNT